MQYVDNWKERYLNSGGYDITNSLYYSLIGGGSSSRISPKNLKYIVPKQNTNILSSGRYKISIHGSWNQYIIGQCINQTYLHVELMSFDGGHIKGFTLKDLTIYGWETNVIAGAGVTLFNGRLLCDPSSQRFDFRNSIICTNLTSLPIACTNTSIVGVEVNNNTNLFFASNLFDDCTIELTQADIDAHTSKRVGFNDCTFKIGAVSRKLTGTSDETFRADFVKMCTDAGITLPETDGVKIPNWGFANDSAIQGIIVEESVLDDFQKAKGAIGYKTQKVKSIPISLNPTTPRAFEKSTVKGLEWLNITDDKLSLKPDFSLTEKNEVVLTSKVINLHGEKKLTDLNILDNLLSGYGINISADHSFIGEPVRINASGQVISGTLEIGGRYLIRSVDKEPTSFTYNKKNLDSSLSVNNILEVVADSTDSTKPLTTFTNIVGQPEFYLVRSYELYQTIEMRIVDEISSAKITSGKLEEGYWYMVEGEEGGTVTFAGNTYPVDCSFLVTSADKDKTISVNKAYLRKCFKEDYQRGDDSFYIGKQQPVWFKVVGDDMRCLRQDNSIYNPEMQYDEELKTYIASGHPRFYNRILAYNGLRYPDFPIKGKYMQVRLHISSFNIM